MKFVDRRTELAQLAEAARFAKTGLHAVLILGPRRIGKTELVRRFAGRRGGLYFFVTAQKTPETLLADFQRELQRAGWLGPRESVTDWDDAVDALFERARGRLAVFDEFQNFQSVHPAIFSTFQRKIDASKRSPLCLVFIGSLVGMMRDLFERQKSPLYGRLQRRMRLEPLAYADVRTLVRGLGWRRERDAVSLHALFGGFPKYYAAIEDYGLGGAPVEDVIDRFWLSDHALFGSEVPDLLREEFGRRRGVYYTILEAVATGHTKFSEIASYAGMTSTSVTRHVNELVEYHQLLVRRVPAGEKAGARRSLYGLANPAFRFWFRFVHRNLSLYESKNFPALRRLVHEDLPSFVGLEFERVCLQMLRRLNERGRLPARFDELGPWWKGDVEIDALGLQRRGGGDLLAAEFKWSDGVDGAGVAADLRAKLGRVPFGARRVHLMVVARSFRTRSRDAACLSIEDVGRAFGG